MACHPSSPRVLNEGCTSLRLMLELTLAVKVTQEKIPHAIANSVSATPSAGFRFPWLHQLARGERLSFFRVLCVISPLQECARGMFQKSVVVVSRYPYVNLFERLVKVSVPSVDACVG